MPRKKKRGRPSKKRVAAFVKRSRSGKYKKYKTGTSANFGPVLPGGWFKNAL